MCSLEAVIVLLTVLGRGKHQIKVLTGSISEKALSLWMVSLSSVFLCEKGKMATSSHFSHPDFICRNPVGLFTSQSLFYQNYPIGDKSSMCKFQKDINM